MAEEQEDGSLSQELEVLQSIYLDELEVSQEERLELRITLHPTTGEDHESQYVRLTLQLSLPPLYPDEPPEISVTHPRGLCDEQIDSIIGDLRRTAAQSRGCPVLYALIEKGKELLTASNLPRGHCVICLYEFQEDDSLTKTQCFHHFHSYCLGRYSQHYLENNPGEEPVECPVCRESLNCDFKKLQAAAPPQHPEERYVPDPLAFRREQELRQVYERQLANGGIIDVEAEKKRFFISIQTPDNEHENGDAAPESDLRPHPCPSESPLTSAFIPQPHAGGHRAAVKNRYGQPWRGGRGWAARNRRVWREEAASKDEQTVRGRMTEQTVRGRMTEQTVRGRMTEQTVRGRMTEQTVRGRMTEQTVRGRMTEQTVRGRMTEQTRPSGGTAAPADAREDSEGRGRKSITYYTSFE
ncbi:E3 ubiquitin-protein ligase RNF25 isoform X2 [Engystomops pustulosus]|uniref:E3 ubiquitin-protein ligase RNF25 isoform X2 n=1 Tax=Engystomops pustulosus TaxID=76066 RepID=UPI003AFAE0E5